VVPAAVAADTAGVEVEDMAGVGAADISAAVEASSAEGIQRV
jgi:hypothetical protein